MNKYILLIFVAAVLGGCAKPMAPVDPLDEYFYDYESLSEPLPLILVDTVGSFDMIIDRDIGYRQDLLEKAEALFPKKCLMIRSENRENIGASTDESGWGGGVEIACAVTGSAVEYYMRLISLYQKGKFEEANTIEPIKASFRYKASVTRHGGFIIRDHEYESVFVVKQELSWSHYCGLVCAFMFFKDRMIIFDQITGELLGVIGEENLIVAVS